MRTLDTRQHRKLSVGIIFLIALMSVGVCLPAAAEQDPAETTFHCEVLKLEGNANVVDKEGVSKKLAEGDLLEVGQTVEVGADSYVDIAYDREWKNISRIEAASKITIVQVYPGKLDLKEGSVYAKLKELPKGSSFQVKTPTAVATVRGTEYRTLFKDGQTDVFNSSASPIYVYGVDADGEVNKKDLVVLKESQKTSVDKPGVPPATPQEMSAPEIESVLKITEHITTNVTTIVTSGRTSQIQSVAELEKVKLGDDDGPSTTAKPTEDSRVEDGRRRPFKKSS